VGIPVEAVEVQVQRVQMPLDKMPVMAGLEHLLL
jgi:hypothetical protein